MLKVKNDDPRLIAEFKELMVKNKDLAKLIVDLYHYIEDAFSKDLIITMIYRTQDEQDSIYRNNIKYKQNPFKSPHQFWHSVDVRSVIFSEEEIKYIENYLNSKYNNSNYYKWTAKCHKVGGGAFHFHIQYHSLAS